MYYKNYNFAGLVCSQIELQVTEMMPSSLFGVLSLDMKGKNQKIYIMKCWQKLTIGQLNSKTNT